MTAGTQAPTKGRGTLWKDHSVAVWRVDDRHTERRLSKQFRQNRRRVPSSHP